MKIINKTKWQTKHLRAFVSKVAQDELEPEKRKRVIVAFVPARQQRGCTGYAYVGGRSCQINVPTKSDPAQWKRSLASTIAHELAHLHGHKGERWMRRSKRYGYTKHTGERYAWADAMPLEEKPAQLKPKATPAEKAEAKRKATEKLIKQWETKEKRAKWFLRKYRKRLRYYERRLAAMPSAPKEDQ